MGKKHTYQINKTSKVLGLMLMILFSLSFTSFNETDKDFKIHSQEISLNTDGLYYAEFYDYIFRGHFEKTEMTTKDMEFLSIFEQYLRSFGRQCASYLPEDQVPIMDLICAREEIEKNLYGDVLSRTCVKWVWVESGLFARPDLYNAKLEVENLQSKDAIQKAFSEMTDPNAIGNSMDKVHRLKGLKNDMARFFSQNACDSKGVERFEENLRRFALNLKSIRMEGSSKYDRMKVRGGPTGSQNLSKLVDDLVANQATTWAMNKYVPSSISRVSINQSDSQGRPKVIRANYTYQFFGQNGEGWVQINFENGLPNCMLFHDFPQNCKTPNSSIVASYAEGNYSN